MGAIFVAILARAELETGATTPLAELPEPDTKNYLLIELIWPIVTFLVVTSVRAPLRIPHLKTSNLYMGI